MRVAPNQAAVIPPPTVQTAVVTPAHAIGQVLRVEVIAQLDLLRYQVRTPEGERLVNSRSPLPLGEKVNLQVLGGDSKLLLVDKSALMPEQLSAQPKSLTPQQFEANRQTLLLSAQGNAGRSVASPPPAQGATLSAPPILRAEVLAQLDSSRYQLSTATGVRIAESRTPLIVGEKLVLQVLASNDKRLTVDKLPTSAQMATTQLKTFVPKQLDASRLMALLPVLAAHAEAPEGIARLLEHLPKPAQLMQADTLQQAMKNSGLFYERGLAQGILPPPEDLKRQILQLRDELKSTKDPELEAKISSGGSPHPAGKVEPVARFRLPTSMLDILSQALTGSLLQTLGQELDGVMARMVSHQLLNAGDEHRQYQQWLMELPVRDRDGIDMLQIHISKDQRQSDQQALGWALWKVSLSISLPDHGAVIATLSQQDERVHVQFHAEQANTHAWLSQHCPSLRQRLIDCGLQVGQVQAQRGLPHSDTLPKGASGLLQERA